ncbi:hypothetical protein PoB_007218500 [Plakobranchus ocellatus]|uniref:Secreted protein n=1 Tax=Plakobranchus ocellatus TaxID=259542 RepID=A0AAV4DP31_9GAST|nr:hypothetical protein PoB_007218500 [Plakobranchus ocellatus]
MRRALYNVLSALAYAHTGGDATCNSRQDGLMPQLLCSTQPQIPLSNRAADVRLGCKTQRIAPPLRQDGSRSRLDVLSPKETLLLDT